ncbi:MAG: hypothetical protein HQ567_13745 [Candidatus Nealsonbacteria bacterium]|nr:hypothetical protein [Candidatus Nealsonbacteria bacterium]
MVRTISTVRTVFACSLLILIAASTGCRMCASPYDYCGPVSTDGCGQECDQGCGQGCGQAVCPDVRQGSILSQGVQPMEYEMQPTLGMEPTLAAPIESDEVDESQQTAERQPPVGKLDLALWNPLADR